MRVPRWRTLLVTGFLAIVGGLVIWAYTHPPLSSFGAAWGIADGRGFVAYDLVNVGPGPVVLRGFRVEGGPVPASVKAVASQGELASSKAQRPASLSPDQIREVAGSRIPPQPHLHLTSDALVLRWAERLPPDRPYSVQLSYWYWGLPMRLQLDGLTVPDNLKPLPPAPAQPDIARWATGDPAGRPVIRQVYVQETKAIAADGWWRLPSVPVTLIAETERATKLYFLSYDPLTGALDPERNSGFQWSPDRESLTGGERWIGRKNGLNAHGRAVYAVAENENGRALSPVLFLQNWPQ